MDLSVTGTALIRLSSWLADVSAEAPVELEPAG